MIIINWVTVLCIYCIILLIAILKCISSLYKKKLTAKQPQAGLSGDIPEEDIIIIGDDSSMHVSASKTL